MKTFEEIILSCGKRAIVDIEDYWWLTTPPIENWHFCSKKYASNSLGLMHKLIWERHFGPPKGEIDHINLNGLDNRKQNLRDVSHRTNCFNRNKTLVNTSGYKGVYWNKRKKKWMFAVYSDRKPIYCGYFLDKRDAAIAYDVCVKRIIKENIYVNVPNATNEDIFRITSILNNPKKIKGTSKYKGVSYHAKRKQWCAYLDLDKKRIHLGWFVLETDAALAYNKFLIENRLNRPLNII